MIEEARRRGRANTRWVHARAEELPLDLGAFRTATFAQSFHWLERERVAATVLEMLEPGGAWVHVDTKTHRGVATDAPLGRPQPLRDEIDELVARYLGPTRRGGPSGEAEIMLAAGFAGPRHRRVTPERVLDRTEDEVVASVFAVSGSAPPLFGPRLAEFESELRKLLRSAAPDGRFRELAPPVELIVWTKPAR
jgi:hypothetical protein